MAKSELPNKDKSFVDIKNKLGSNRPSGSFIINGNKVEPNMNDEVMKAKFKSLKKESDPNEKK